MIGDISLTCFNITNFPNPIKGPSSYFEAGVLCLKNTVYIFVSSEKLVRGLHAMVAVTSFPLTRSVTLLSHTLTSFSSSREDEKPVFANRC